MSFLFRALAVLCLVLTGTAAHAQGYPSKPITFVVPLPETVPPRFTHTFVFAAVAYCT